MLKLNASYQKKIPAEVDFSSKCFHASIEIELPDGLNEDQLKQRIHSTFELVKNSVENEINGKAAVPAASATAQPPQANSNGKNINLPATKKQVKFLLDIANEKAVDITPHLRKCNAGSAYDLNREQCSRMIDQIR